MGLSGRKIREIIEQYLQREREDAALAAANDMSCEASMDCDMTHESFIPQLLFDVNIGDNTIRCTFFLN